MNKKGMMNFAWGFIGLFILMLAAVSLVGIQSGQESEEAISLLVDIQDKYTGEHYANDNNHSVIKITYSFIGFVVYSATEVAILAVEYGVTNPEWVNPIILLWIIMFSLLAPIITVLFKLGVIIFLLIKEHFQSKKEKLSNAG